ncbi:MFS transporter [Streptomyces sp. NPDC048639]|uniref:MFS transporter n=1 Tax=Streptomyces sp. NPDC048639 TaxID=3365581 RepID=UPI0037131338
MVLLDQTVVAVILVPMTRSLGISVTAAHRVLLIYLLALSSLTAVGAMAARKFGLLRTFWFGVMLFTLASGCCGLTPEGDIAEPFLLISRALQGAGAALLLPVATTLIADVYEDHERAGALTTYAGAAQVFFVIGPLVGALLAQFLSWRCVFFLNIPVGVAIICFITRARLGREAVGGRFLVGQPVLMISALAAVVFGLFQIGIWGPGDIRTMAILTLGILLLAISIAFTLRASRPLVELRLLRNRPYRAAVTITFLVQGAQLIAVVHGTVHLQQDLHLSILDSGVAILPLVIALAVGTCASAYLLDRFRSIRVTALSSLGCATLGMAGWTSVFVAGTYAWQIPGMIVAGLGMGAPIPALSAEMMRVVRVEQRADASVLRQTLRQLGGALGLAVAGALVLSGNDKASDAAGAIAAPAAVSGFVFASIVLGAAFLVAALIMPRE